MSPRFLILALLGGATLAPALAAALPSDELERRC